MRIAPMLILIGAACQGQVRCIVRKSVVLKVTSAPDFDSRTCVRVESIVIDLHLKARVVQRAVDAIGPSVEDVVVGVTAALFIITLFVMVDEQPLVPVITTL